MFLNNELICMTVLIVMNHFRFKIATTERASVRFVSNPILRVLVVIGISGYCKFSYDVQNMTIFVLGKTADVKQLM